MNDWIMKWEGDTQKNKKRRNLWSEIVSEREKERKRSKNENFSKI